jgi:hypothetical protein
MLYISATDQNCSITIPVQQKRQHSSRNSYDELL